jgi:hypothetical protein
MLAWIFKKSDALLEIKKTGVNKNGRDTISH